jgi:orotidine-5'-phosphate decarboxylase
MPNVPSRERLIAALDVPTAAEARTLAERLGDAVGFYKIGLELFTAGGYFELLQWLRGRGSRVFADLKLYDIPETVRRAVANLRSSGASFLTVHAERSILEAAATEKGALKVLGVTVLTSFDQRAVAEMGYGGSLEDLVVQRARVVLESGGDGVIASGLEAPRLRKEFGDRLLIVTPGVRPAGAGAQDQKRVVDVARAFANGADYIVVGRPIRDVADPRAAAEDIQATIAGALRR